MALELRTVLRCEHGEALLPNCSCVSGLKHVAAEAEELLRERDRIFDALMALVRELPTPSMDGNAPIHSHCKPGVWDDPDAQGKARPCALCAAYAQAVAIVGRKP